MPRQVRNSITRLEAWSKLASDGDAAFDREVSLDGAHVAPIVTWGTSPQDALPIDASVPDPARETNAERAKYLRDALDYMGIAPGKKLTDINVDRVFIGSCTNARIEDLRAAAAVLSGRSSKVPGLVSAGSSLVKRQAEDEGLDRIFRDAGLEWGEFGLFDVRRHQRRSGRTGRALRLDHQSQFSRPPGSRRADTPNVAGDGGGCRCHRPSRRCA